MYFQPADETALRHLFSSNEAIMEMSYIGPVLDPSGRILTSPDCLVLDKRGEKWRIRRCEFKYEPESISEYAHNGRFDITVVWRVAPSVRDSLREGLRTQNGCEEIVALSDYPAFNRLDRYRAAEAEALVSEGVKKVERILLNVQNTGYATAYVAYIATAIYPLAFDLGMMKDAISGLPEVQGMLPQGRGNVISKLLQTKPPLITRLSHHRYRWVGAIHADGARKTIASIITTRFGKEIPDDDVIARFRSARQ